MVDNNSALSFVEYSIYILSIALYFSLLIARAVKRDINVIDTITIVFSVLMAIVIGICGYRENPEKPHRSAKVLVGLYILYLIVTDIVKVSGIDNTGENCDAVETTSIYNTDAFPTVYRYIIMLSLLLFTCFISTGVVQESAEKTKAKDIIQNPIVKNPLLLTFIVIVFYGLSILIDWLMSKWFSVKSADGTDNAITPYDIYIKYFDKDLWWGGIWRIIGLIIVGLGIFSTTYCLFDDLINTPAYFILLIIFIFILLPVLIRFFYTDDCFYNKFTKTTTTDEGGKEDKSSNETKISKRVKNTRQDEFYCLIERFGGIRVFVILILNVFVWKNSSG